MSLTTDPVASHPDPCLCEKCLSALRHGEMLDKLADIHVLLEKIGNNLVQTIAENTKK